jgi:hypothetical protein
MTKLEKEYYPIVEKWLSKKHKCFRTVINKGLRYSRPDVIGVRDIDVDHTGEIETIIVEVKRDKEPFASASGQTFGYTVYANRVYLADKRQNSFSNDEIQIASHLGIGLISIDDKDNCNEVLSSPYYKTLPKLNMQLLETINLGKCQLCSNYVEIGNENKHFANLTRGKLDKAIQTEKGIIFWNNEVGQRKIKYGIRVNKDESIGTYERRFLCPDCVQLLGGLKNK